MGSVGSTPFAPMSFLTELLGALLFFVLLIPLQWLAEGCAVLGLFATMKVCEVCSGLSHRGCMKLHGGSIPPLWSLPHLLYYVGIVMQSTTALFLIAALTTSDPFLSFSSTTTYPIDHLNTTRTVNSTVTLTGLWHVDVVEREGTDPIPRYFSFGVWDSDPPHTTATSSYTVLAQLQGEAICLLLSLTFILPTAFYSTLGCCREMRRGRVIPCHSPFVGFCDAFHPCTAMWGSLLIFFVWLGLLSPAGRLAKQFNGRVEMTQMELGAVEYLHVAVTMWLASMLLMMLACGSVNSPDGGEVERSVEWSDHDDGKEGRVEGGEGGEEGSSRHEQEEGKDEDSDEEEADSTVKAVDPPHLHLSPLLGSQRSSSRPSSNKTIAI